MVVSFYGLGGAGGFGNDWLDKIADHAAEQTGSSLRQYDEDDGGRALKDTLHSIDRNHNKVIEKSEATGTNLRVVGYSFGGIQAANFARYLRKVGQTVKGYLIRAAIPIRALVTLDPVQSVIKNTSGIPSNVARFGNYYQQKGGSTTVDVYTDPLNIKVTSISVPDPANIKGAPLDSSAKQNRQIRIDSGDFADKTVTHSVYSHAKGKIKGKNVNHGTLPFYAYDWAMEDLTA